MKNVWKNIVFLILLNGFCQFSHGQSFNFYTIYQYGDELSNDHYKKVHKAEWHKQEAKFTREEIRELEHKLKALEDNPTKNAKKISSVNNKITKLQLENFDHIQKSNGFYYSVYRDKLDTFKHRYKYDQKNQVALNAMERQGDNVYNEGVKTRTSIDKTVDDKEKISVFEKANKREKDGLNLLSAALEGYYNYELELKEREKNQEGISENVDVAELADAEVVPEIVYTEMPIVEQGAEQPAEISYLGEEPQDDLQETGRIEPVALSGETGLTNETGFGEDNFADREYERLMQIEDAKSTLPATEKGKSTLGFEDDGYAEYEYKRVTGTLEQKPEKTNSSNSNKSNVSVGTDLPIVSSMGIAPVDATSPNTENNTSKALNNQSTVTSNVASTEENVLSVSNEEENAIAVSTGEEEKKPESITPEMLNHQSLINTDEKSQTEPTYKKQDKTAIDQTGNNITSNTSEAVTGNKTNTEENIQEEVLADNTGEKIQPMLKYHTTDVNNEQATGFQSNNLADEAEHSEIYTDNQIETNQEPENITEEAVPLQNQPLAEAGKKNSGRRKSSKSDDGSIPVSGVVPPPLAVVAPAGVTPSLNGSQVANNKNIDEDIGNQQNLETNELSSYNQTEPTENKQVAVVSQNENPVQTASVSNPVMQSENVVEDESEKTSDVGQNEESQNFYSPENQNINENLVVTKTETAQIQPNKMISEGQENLLQGQTTDQPTGFQENTEVTEAQQNNQVSQIDETEINSQQELSSNDNSNEDLHTSKKQKRKNRKKSKGSSISVPGVVPVVPPPVVAVAPSVSAPSANSQVTSNSGQQLKEKSNLLAEETEQSEKLGNTATENSKPATSDQTQTWENAHVHEFNETHLTSDITYTEPLKENSIASFNQSDIIPQNSEFKQPSNNNSDREKEERMILGNDMSYHTHDKVSTDISEVAKLKGVSKDIQKSSMSEMATVTNSSGVIFRVQIAADMVKLGKEELQSRYNGNRDVIEFKEDGWFKYSVGDFSSFEEAKIIRDNTHVHDAFVAAYIDGEKVPVWKAERLFRLQERQQPQLRVQVAASRTEMSPEELHKRYNGGKPLKMIYEDGWFKYSIYGGESLEEAIRIKNETHVSDAFVVAYRGSKKVPINKALSASK